MEHMSRMNAEHHSVVHYFVLFVSITLVLCLLLFILIFIEPKLRFQNSIPGPTIPSYLFGHLASIKPGSFHKYLLDCRNQYGKTYQLWIIHRRTLVITDLKDVRFITTTKNYPKSSNFISSLNPLLRTGLITVSNDIHPSQRRTIAARFNKQFLTHLHSHLETELARFILKLDKAADSKQILDFDKEVTAFALNVICRVAFGSSVDFQGFQNDGKSQSVDFPALMDNGIRLTADYMWHQPHLRWLGKYAAPKLYSIVAEMRLFCNEMIDLRRNETPQQRKLRKDDDLLDLFLSIPGNTNEYICAEVATFLFAGHDTTSHTLAWLVYELCSNRDVTEKLNAEIQSTTMRSVTHCLNDTASVVFEIPDFEQVQKELVFTEMCWKESLRKRPVVASGTYRTVTESVELPGSKVFAEKGTDVLLPPYVMHRDEDVWKNSKLFDPERFTRENSIGRSAFALQTFSSGARNCIGQLFATHEGITTIATLFRRFRFQLATDSDDITEDYSLTMRPKSKSMRMNLPLHVSIR
eukprot:CAMPEP_0182445312 /NCGR_PEP_ID=MMETSP1172-20130603/3481_1 /TAXON_ID=708627 /ORGANISM="Timspurckia oligopyrenoides, Strain CCMP3278" /LENGTH=523 /DNA_ID=CAMNT_0024641059 /DNA_START=120 /DNA_END=1691 /DNA_ORIENTATION=-